MVLRKLAPLGKAIKVVHVAVKLCPWLLVSAAPALPDLVYLDVQLDGRQELCDPIATGLSNGFLDGHELDVQLVILQIDPGPAGGQHGVGHGLLSDGADHGADAFAHARRDGASQLSGLGPFRGGEVWPLRARKPKDKKITSENT